MRVNNAPKYIRRRVLVAFWGTVVAIEAIWVVPMFYSLLDSKLG